MWLLDQWAERHIAEAQAKGEFDNLAGSGEPLILDDDSHVPPELRAGYRLLKNAGCLPPELEQRREAGKNGGSNTRHDSLLRKAADDGA